MPERLPPTDPAAAIAWLKRLARRKKREAASVANLERTSPAILAQLDRLATPRVDPAEAIRRMEATGRTVTLVGPAAYTVKGASAHLLFEGTHVSDENYICDPLGALNISKAWRGIRKIQPDQVYRLPIDAALLHQVASGDLEIGPLKEMTAERRALPVLMARERRGAFLIDGNHRVVARAMERISWVHCFIINEMALQDIKVRIWKLGEDGTRSEIDTTKGHIAIF